MKFEKVERIIYPLLFVLLLIGLAIDLFEGPLRFEHSYVPEDGWIENGTAVLLFIGAIVLLNRFFKFKLGKSIFWKLGTLGLAFLFFFGGGEEISWGQRIFGWETGELLKGINKQGETNLHNLKFGDVDINKLIFSKLMTVAIIFYLIIIPLIIDKWIWLNKTIHLWGIPLPKWSHTITFILMAVIVLPISSGKKWELFEFGFAAIFLLIFLYPSNRKHIQ